VLSRRLYLYSATAPANPAVSRFIGFAKSKAGQDIVAANGFVEQTVQAQDKSAVAPGPDVPAAYRQATANASRLSLNFRFRTGSKELDTKAIPDLERVLTFITDVKMPASNIVLLGFADARGAADANVKLSIERAGVIADEFKLRGITPGVVTGFGAAMPVASNDTADGQEKNRRVEIWVKR
jgi:phosphate transport system substrate-binding protein